MRFKDVAFSIALTMVATGTAHAGQKYLGLTGGAGLPTGNYGDVANTGWNIGATTTNHLNDIWGIGVDLGYHAWGGSDEFNLATELFLTGEPSEWTFSGMQATAHAIASLPTQSQFKPYIKLGTGLYRTNAKLSTSSGDGSETFSKLGFNIGGGFDILDSSTHRWGVGASYHLINAEEDMGFDPNFFTMNVSMKFGVGQ